MILTMLKLTCRNIGLIPKRGKPMNAIERLFLKIILRRLERKMVKDFDRDLSLRIDAIRFLLEK